MTIFVSILNFFEADFKAAGAVAKIGSSLKSNHISKFSLPKSVKHTVAYKRKELKAGPKGLNRLK
jgi:hypothetical protein